MENSVRCSCAALGHWFSFGPWVGKIPWRKEWQPTPVFLPGEFRGQRSLVGYNPWDPKESDTTEQLTFSLFTFAQPLGPRYWALPGGASGSEPSCQSRRHKRRGFSPWVGKIPWRRKWQPTPVFLPGESHGQRSLAGCGP